MFFRWLKSRRRRKILSEPFPSRWLEILHRDVPQFGQLAPKDQSKLRNDMQVFISEKTWVGADLEVSDVMKVTIASQACLLLLGFQKHDYFANVITIIVTPTTMVDDVEASSGLVHPDGAKIEGQTSYRGPVLLSWTDAHGGVRNHDDGRNVVLHEFAHKLDMMDHLVDGTPVLRHQKHYPQWIEVMTLEYESLVEDAEKGRGSLLDHYGATNHGEFFAVATECFFEQGRLMRREHQRLYEVLSQYYGQDPASWDMR
jgi:Mlc titration factor MtfA (ptsG expression regulator)